jgi:hypothetical protein
VLTAALVLAPRFASAHVGSPDVFLDARAGPYRVLVTVRPPRAIPGVADVEVLSPANELNRVHIVPLPLTGPGAQFAPTPDVAVRSADTPSLSWRHSSARDGSARAKHRGRQRGGAAESRVPSRPF